MSDADNGQRLGAILARLRAVAASPSAQSGRLPEGDMTASAAQLDTQSVSHAVAGGWTCTGASPVQSAACQSA
eukprot:scaffold5567_cov108-Isochrysis_galbana.AAC.3